MSWWKHLLWVQGTHDVEIGLGWVMVGVGGVFMMVIWRGGFGMLLDAGFGEVCFYDGQAGIAS